MYIIVSYDVNSEKCAKIMKILRKYLFHIHNSLFEGEITEKYFFNLKQEINEINITDEDRIVIYMLISNKVLKKEHIGTKRDINLII